MHCGAQFQSVTVCVSMVDTLYESYHVCTVFLYCLLYTVYASSYLHEMLGSI